MHIARKLGHSTVAVALVGALVTLVGAGVKF